MEWQADKRFYSSWFCRERAGPIQIIVQCSEFIMHGAIQQLLVFWALAFLTLGAALICLNIFCSLIDNGLELLSVGKELAVAGIASLVEAGSLWLVVSFVPAAGRAMIIPALIVALIYKVAHFEDWNRFEVILLLLFQTVIGCLGACLVFGQYKSAMVVLIGISVILGIIAGFAKFFDT